MSRLFCCCLVVLLCACSEQAPGPVNLEQAKGHWTVVNYWAEWCAPCIREIPELNQLANDYPNIKVLGVNFDGATGEELQAQVAKLGVEFPTLAADPAPRLGTVRPSVLPTTLILSPEGVVADTLLGPQTLESLLSALELEPSPQH